MVSKSLSLAAKFALVITTAVVLSGCLERIKLFSGPTAEPVVVQKKTAAPKAAAVDPVVTSSTTRRAPSAFASGTGDRSGSGRDSNSSQNSSGVSASSLGSGSNSIGGRQMGVGQPRP